MTKLSERPVQGAMTIKAFCRWAGIGRTTAYDQVNLGRLTVRKVGRRSVILVEDAVRWLEQLPTQEEALDAFLGNISIAKAANDAQH